MEKNMPKTANIPIEQPDAVVPTRPQSRTVMRLARNLGHSPLIICCAVILIALIMLGIFAPLVAPYDPTDIGGSNLLYADLPPSLGSHDGMHFIFGTDNQGRDLLSAILYGLRISLFVGFASVMLALLIGVPLGLMAGYLGGWVDALIMRIADIKMSFPTIIVALLVNGSIRAAFPGVPSSNLAVVVLILTIGLSTWVQYARVMRSSTIVEKNKEYVQAAWIIGRRRSAIMARHILPNTLGAISVLATVNFGVAILTEATLSFLGAGVPPNIPSLGSLIRIGNEFIFSGLWWIVVIPSIVLMLIVSSANLVGDWLRDELNPKLR